MVGRGCAPCAGPRPGHVDAGISARRAARVLDEDLVRELKDVKVEIKLKNGKRAQLPIQWRESCRDEYTQDGLSPGHIRAAMLGEIKYLCSEVVGGAS